MATERIQIIVSTSGAVTVKRELEDIGNSASKSVGGVGLLRQALGALGGLSIATAFINYSDSATRLSNSLRVAGLEGNKFNSAQSTIYATAIRNGQSAEALANVYQKLIVTQKDLGINSKQVDQGFTGIAAAMKLSTAGTSAQQGALQQLSQLMGGAVIQAQEYNSLIDGAFPLVQAAARGIDGMGGSVAKLTATIKEGGFSTQTFFQGLLKGLQETEAQASKTPLTIGQAWVSLQQAFTQALDSFNQISGASNALARAIEFVAANINIFLLALTPLAAALLIFATQTIAVAVVGAFSLLATTITTVVLPALAAFTAFLAANPLVLIGVAVAALIAYFIKLANELGSVKAAFDAILSAGVNAMVALIKYIEKFVDILKKGLNLVIDLFAELFNWIKNKVVDAVTIAIKIGEKFINLFSKGVNNIIQLFNLLATTVQNTVASAFNSVFGGIIAIVKKVIDAVLLLIKLLETAKKLGGGSGAGGAGGKTGGKTGGAGGGGGGRGFREGGSFTVGGSGAGTDKTPVSFNANRGERVTVETTKQQRQSSNVAVNGQAPDVKVPVSITNVFDAAMIPVALQSQAGQRSIMNILKANRDEINSALGLA
jgi:tape measure domain-containing protein